MAEYIDREEYCEKRCRCSNEYCDRASCPIWKAPAAHVAPVVHGKPRTETRTVQTAGYHEEMGVRAEDGATLYRKTMVHVDVPYEYCPACGAALCSHWNNYCGKCGAKMDRGDGDE